ncbi:hypothetical protein F4823DRAFT_111541 [Ustulina deusta]|nr:hypothetical protein F4823DRAFT_111541 [Ustulina deusta]
MSTAQYLPTRLASRETGLSAILRRKTATQKIWPNPERSVGRFICKIGKESIWEAQGEAREVFKTIAPDIKRYLDSCVEPIPSWVTWSMYMMGHAVSSACPTIVFCCDVVAHRREVRNTIKLSGILNGYPGVKTGHMPRAPDFDRLVPLAAGNSGSRGTIQLHMSPSALGMPLLITGQQRSTKATIGGVIRVGSKYFYTTAAHPFQTYLDVTSPLGQPAFGNQSNRDIDDDACSFDGDSDTTFEVESELPPLNNVTAEDGKAHAHEDLFPLKTKEQEALEQTTRNDDNPHTILRPTEPDPDHESSLGSSASMGGLQFDYHGEFFLLPRDSPGAEADFALLEVTDNRHWVQNVVSIPPNGNSKVTITSLSDTDSSDTPGTHIQAITSRGNIKGRLSDTPFYARTPNDRAFQEMLCATFSSSLEKGDCGAWIINTDTGGLYGHIVAGSPNSGTALIKLFKDVFEHIRYRTGYLPTFPVKSPKENFSEGPSIAQFRSCGVSPGAPSMIRGEGRPKYSLKHTKDGIEENINIRASTASNSSGLPPISGPHGASEDVTYKGKAIQTREAAVEESMGPFACQFKRNTREGRKPRKLIYPALLHPNNNARFGTAVMNSRPDQYGIGLPSDAALLPQPSLRPAKESKKFCNLLSSLSRKSLGWENSGLLDEALRRIPLDRIYNDAENEFNTFTAIAMSIEAPRPKWGYQDCVVRALMRWFRRDYFTWVNNPVCDSCLHPTVSKGVTGPTQEENIFGALRVELYQCTHSHCSRLTRFPRYTDPWVLMETSRGRVGEWVHVFSLFCYAIGARTRWVWSAEDYLWVEVYSKHVDRWVHVDVIEGAWDDPVLYSERWGKALSYCIAFSTEGAVDVTRRYVREEKLLKPRNRCSELTLFYMLKRITAERREKLSKEVQERLRLGDAAEQKELQTFRVLSVTRELIVSLAPPSEPGPSQQRPKIQGSRNIPPKLALEKKWLEDDTRKLIDDYCEWDSVSRHR